MASASAGNRARLSAVPFTPQTIGLQPLRTLVRRDFLFRGIDRKTILLFRFRSVLAVAIGTMTASRTAAVTAFQQIRRCEDVVTVFDVVIFAFDELGWAAHGFPQKTTLRQAGLNKYQIPITKYHSCRQLRAGSSDPPLTLLHRHSISEAYMFPRDGRHPFAWNDNANEVQRVGR